MARKSPAFSLVAALAVLLAASGVFAAPKPPANQAPVVTAFDVPDNSASPIPVLVFAAADADGSVVAYMITETSAKPAASDPRWLAVKPAQYPTTASGTITLFAWAKDDASGVSDSLSHAVVIPPPPVNADTLDGKHADEFAAAAHAHDAAYVNEGQVGSIAAPMIADGAVTNAKIADGAVTEDKLAAAVTGRISAVEALVADLQATVAGLQTQIAAQQGQIAGLEARVAVLESTPEVALGNYVSISTEVLDGLAGPHIIFTGANVHVRNGLGQSGAPNGLGNLIVGYNEDVPAGTVGRGGSHNLVIGSGHQYGGVTGVVTGSSNTIADIGSAVLGGYYNSATGRFSSIVGGLHNTADAYYSAAFGGQANASGGFYSAIVGGSNNQITAQWDNGGFIGGGAYNAVTGPYGAILGGSNNFAASYGTVSGSASSQALGNGSTVSGGVENVADGDNCSVSGGRNNTATGYQASVSGGSSNTASGPYASVSGGTSNLAIGSNASVSGGAQNTAGGYNTSVTGGEANNASGSNASVNGGLFNSSIGMWTTVGGGLQNTAGGDKFTIGGGKFLDYTSPCIAGWAANGLYQCQ